MALSRPEDLGLPFAQWSVSKLKAYCLKEGLIAPITDEWLRRLLRREGVSYQHTKTWKQSPDPEFEVKKPRPRPLRAMPGGWSGRLLRRCGPLELRPLPGQGWAPVGHPQRFRATYRRLQGTEQLLAFYDVHADCLVGQVCKRRP
ncbi:MAG: hypothetical protein HS107_04370 [Thermoflexaceae bacterium]|nr:hypothetical protein [Thermoflexaceae bacterium]